MNEYLKSFVIGSSLPVFFLFFLKVASLDNNIKNYSYKTYTFIAPLYFGIMNMISRYLQNKYNLTLRERFLLIGIISPIIVMIFAKLMNSYNITEKEWIRYYIRLFLKHFLTYNLIIYFLEANI